MGAKHIHCIFILSSVAVLCSCMPLVVSGCFPTERSALLEFRQGLEDPADRLSSWAAHDCCSWEGVACDNRTGHVVELDLRNTYSISDDDDDLPYIYHSFPDVTYYYEDHPYDSHSLRGELRPALLGLKYLTYLDLSMNYFGDISIPAFIGSLRNLKYLNLSYAGLSGTVPHRLGNLSSLESLDLSSHGSIDIDDALWISRLSSLKQLNMNEIQFSEDAQWLSALNMLPRISEIRLSWTGLLFPPSLQHVNFTSLTLLDLSENSINSTIPSWLFNISSLEHLDLRFDSFQGPIPPGFGKLASLEFLDLSDNNFLAGGGLPSEFGSLCMMRSLELGSTNVGTDMSELKNAFTGCIKNNLESLSLDDNKMTGQLPGWLWDLRKLEHLDLRDNSISGPIPSSIGLLTSLQELYFSNNELNGTIPETLGKLGNMVFLDLSSNKLEGVVSESHLDNLSKLQILHLSSNSLEISVRSDWIPPFQLLLLDLSHCKRGLEVPSWLRQQEKIISIEMSNAGISDYMPVWFWSFSRNLSYIDISNNEIKGRIPDLRHLSKLQILYLGSNYFEGPLPQFPSSLENLDLSNNSFSGAIDPSTISSMPNLGSLSLPTNMLSGEIPRAFCTLQHLWSLDLSGNVLGCVHL